jgi:hypothetical protein
LTASSSAGPPTPAVGKRPKIYWEEAASPKKIEPVTIEEAVEAYLTDAKARELREATLYKLEIIFRKQVLAWAKDKGLRYLKEIDLSLLCNYRSMWKRRRAGEEEKAGTPDRLLLVLYQIRLAHHESHPRAGTDLGGSNTY